jgi:hypothetical protein
VWTFFFLLSFRRYSFYLGRNLSAKKAKSVRVHEIKSVNPPKKKKRKKTAREKRREDLFFKQIVSFFIFCFALGT